MISCVEFGVQFTNAYVDIHVRMLENMYHRRLNGYASIGYKVKVEAL